MKATFTIIAAVFTLQAGILFAGNETISTTVANESAITTIAPSVPLEATFDDATIAVVDFVSIAPSTPVEADFSDVAPSESFDLMSLTPVTPVVADFNDSIDLTVDVSALAPVAPTSADFE